MGRPKIYTTEEAKELQRERVRLAQRERRAKGGRLVIDLGEPLISTLKGYASSTGLSQTEIVAKALESLFKRKKLLPMTQDPKQP